MSKAMLYKDFSPLITAKRPLGALKRVKKSFFRMADIFSTLAITFMHKDMWPGNVFDAPLCTLGYDLHISATMAKLKRL